MPPYSPDFNPIELVFGHVKKWLKRNGVAYTNPVDVLNAAFVDVSVADVRGYCRHCGYA